MSVLRPLVRRALVLVASIALGALSTAQVSAPVTLLKEGDAIPGIGNVTSIFNVFVNNSGDWLVEADTDHPDATRDVVLLKNGVVFMREGDAVLPAGAAISSFDDLTLGNNGDSSFNLFLDNLPISQDSGLYFNATVVVPEGSISSAPEFSPGTPYIGYFGTKFADDVTPGFMVIASVDDPAIASTVDRALVRIDVDSVGNLISETVIAKEGDVPAGVAPDAITEFGTNPHEFAMNSFFDVFYTVDLSGLSAANQALYLNSTLVARKGDVSPFASRTWDVVGSALDLSETGEYVFRGNLSGATGDDDIIVRNGTVKVIQEGDTLPAIGGVFTFTAFGTGNVQLGDATLLETFWYGDWNDPDTDRDTGLFRDDQLLVQEGVTTTSGGQLVERLVGVLDNFVVSDNGRFVIFRGDLAVGISAAMLLDLGEQMPAFCFGDGIDPNVTTACPCGNFGSLAHGCGNSVATTGALLSVTGTTVPDTVQFTVVDIPPSVGSIYLQGDTLIQVGVVFGDGVRCAGGQLTRLGLKIDTDNDGSTTFGPASGDVQVSVGGSVVPGNTYAYQTYYRNPNPGWCPPATFNVSQGIKIAW